MISLITDSACDLTLDLIEKYNVVLLPVMIDINGKIYRDMVDISPSKFFELTSQPNVNVKTSQITPNEFVAAFQKELDKGNDVIYISMTSQLSGTFNSANIGKNMLNNDEQKRVHLIDARVTSVCQGTLVKEAAEKIQKGASLQEVLDHIEVCIGKQEAIITFNTLSALKDSGRIPSSIATIGDFLNIKVLLNFKNGKLSLYSKTRGSKLIAKNLVKYFKEHNPDISKEIIVAHANNHSLCEKIKTTLLEEFPTANVVCREIGVTISRFSGPGAAAIFFQTV